MLDWINEFYKTGERLLEDLRKIRKYGKTDKENGDFDFNKCEKCGGPTLSHKVDPNECKRGEYTEEEIMAIKEALKESHRFNICIVELDERQLAVKCNICEKTFPNRWEKEGHIKTEHMEVKNEGNNDPELRSVMISMMREKEKNGQQRK
jgi:ribosomal protein L32